MTGRETLYVIAHREYSGGEISQAPVLAADSDALVACPVSSPADEYVRSLGASTVDLPFRVMRHSAGPVEAARSVGRGLGSAAELRRILRRHPERRTVYGIGIRAGLLSSLAALGLGRRVVWSVTDRLPPRPLSSLVRVAAWASADRLLCLSQFIATDLVRRSRRLAERSSVVHPGIDPDRFGPAAADSPPRAALVGHISQAKRPDLALDIVAAALERDATVRLRLVGSGQFTAANAALERDLRARVAGDERLRSAVEFAGRQADVAASLTDCRLLLHCRADEPFGMVLVEAMASGLPVVAPAGGGPLEVVEHGVTGLLFEPGNVEEAAGHLVLLARDPALAARMGEAGRKRVARRFTAARQVEETRSALGAGA